MEVFCRGGALLRPYKLPPQGGNSHLFFIRTFY